MSAPRSASASSWAWSAKAQGKTLGRPPIDAEKEAAISADLRLGKAGIMKVAAAHGVGVGTVQRIKAALAA